jgi:LacI family transcriptional regulator
MSITTKDVALKAGVSSITVSRTFSGTHTVAEETRQKVIQAAQELSYVPNLLARGLVQRRSPVIGLIVQDLANLFYGPFIEAVQDVAQQRDHMLIVSQSHNKVDTEFAQINQLRQLQVSGCLIAAVDSDASHLRMLKESGMPMVVIFGRWEEGNYVAVDDFAAGQIVGKHLLDQGHHRLGWVMPGGLDSLGSGRQQCRQGFEAALAERGLEAGFSLTTESGITTAEGREAAEVFLRQRNDVSAVFVRADRVALGFIHGLLEAGVRVPEEVAVIGYGDTHRASIDGLPLTTVAVPKWEAGRRAAEILFSRIEGAASEQESQQILLDPSLIIRKTCGAKDG